MNGSLPPSVSALLSRAGTSRLSWIAFGAAAIAALGVSLGVLLWFEHDAQLDDAANTAQKLARALDRHTEATFALVDSALRSATGEMERAARGGQLTDDVIDTILRRSVDGESAIHSMSIHNANGMLTHITLLPKSPRVDT